MTDREYKALAARVRKAVKRWYPILQDRFNLEIQHKRERRADDDNVAGETWAAWEYQHGVICFYLPVVADYTDSELSNLVLHEFAHVLLNPLKGDDTKLNEFTVEVVARALEIAGNQKP